MERMNKVGVGREGVEKSGGKGVAGMIRLEWGGIGWREEVYRMEIFGWGGKEWTEWKGWIGWGGEGRIRLRGGKEFT